MSGRRDRTLNGIRDGERLRAIFSGIGAALERDAAGVARVVGPHPKAGEDQMTAPEHSAFPRGRWTSKISS